MSFCTITLPFCQVDTNRIVHIHSVIILRRSDKRKDRVEISPEQLSAASTEAEISFHPSTKFVFTLYCLLSYQIVELLLSALKLQLNP